MTIRTLLAIAAAMALAGCGLPRDVREMLGPEPAGRDYPEILPLSGLLAEGAAASEDAEAQAEADAALADRTEALSGRAGALPEAGAGSSGADLARRSQALADRAEALRASPP